MAIDLVTLVLAVDAIHVPAAASELSKLEGVGRRIEMTAHNQT